MKKTMKAGLIALVLLGVSLLPVFAGGQSSAPGKTKITVWEHGTQFEDSLKQVIAGFNKKNPTITVEYEIKSTDYYSVLNTAIQSREAPDLFWTHGNKTTYLADYVKNNAVVALDGKVDFSVMPPSGVAISVIDGKLYSIPWLTMDTRAVYYNVDMFKQHGWTVPATFAEFEALLGKIKDAGIIPISLSPNDSWALLFAFEPILSGFDPVYTRGLDNYSVSATGKPVGDVLAKMLEWGDKGYYGANWLGVTDNNAQILAFTTGKAAMNIAGSWEAATISSNNPALNYSAFSVPAADGTTGLVGTPASGFSVSSNSKNMDAALLFADYCASLEAQTIWVRSQGGLSAIPQIQASTAIADAISKSSKGNIYTSWQSVLNNFSRGGQAANIYDQDITRVFSKDLSVADFLKRIAAEMN
ncbi:ABC transporter substrate-binding protein [Leadbettera azotonutricia]|uniref:Putative extracellular solute-binding protein, family 1 n=1 Tax=Leadbettera azotonutricia (strain ATCC BAA-888 / DSM 13862 / ZAS-9) TaxID=545695 RepID=F5Y9Z0_LEAAZ|nr:extracellular solute-binding protein [Leadbettera azotonutricia]AEF83340.1 putative extracellular solute-binding protein, family 1 [Leadbettera azotonutricia ZAS-9]